MPAQPSHLTASQWASGESRKRKRDHDADDIDAKSTTDHEGEYIYNPLSTDPSYLSQIWPTGKTHHEIAKWFQRIHLPCSCKESAFDLVLVVIQFHSRRMLWA